ncbi:hypothetical protein MYX76_01140 [Desulfobacterota bacterium AH_259_B03_O07]|nr:hypothetical protein [Desulfobacterota bacterium AH_259_B03_O07]
MDLQSVLKCPECGFEKEEIMPVDACQFFYECTNCKKVLKPKEGESADDARSLSNGDTAALIHSAIQELSVDEARNASHVYARILKKAIQKHLMLDDLLMAFLHRQIGRMELFA